MKTIHWSGFNYGHVEDTEKQYVTPFQFSQEGEEWKLLFHGGQFFKQKGDWMGVSLDQLETIVLKIYSWSHVTA